MKKQLVLLMIASMFCGTKLTANVLNEIKPVIPYAIDFTQTGSKPDEANASWTYDKRAKMHPSDWLHEFWNNIKRTYLLWSGRENKIRNYGCGYARFQW